MTGADTRALMRSSSPTSRSKDSYEPPTSIVSPNAESCFARPLSRPQAARHAEVPCSRASTSGGPKKLPFSRVPNGSRASLPFLFCSTKPATTSGRASKYGALAHRSMHLMGPENSPTKNRADAGTISLRTPPKCSAKESLSRRPNKHS